MLVYCFGVFGVFVNFFRYKILPLLLPSVSCWTDVTYYPQIKLHSPNAGKRKESRFHEQTFFYPAVQRFRRENLLDT